jgi:hypothetical protein
MEKFMRDKRGKRPIITSQEQAFKEIRRLAMNKQGHLMADEHIAWLELKMKEIVWLSGQGLKIKR